MSVTLFPLYDAGGGGGGGENPNVRFIVGSMRHHFHIFKIAFLFYTIQNKSEKNIHAMIIRIHTCKSKLNLFFLEPYLQRTASTKFYKSTSSSILFLVVFLNWYVLNQFQLWVCNVYPAPPPPPPPNFSTDLAFFRDKPSSFLRFLQWSGETAKGSIFLALLPG
jgi:hypothetical protein